MTDRTYKEMRQEMFTLKAVLKTYEEGLRLYAKNRQDAWLAVEGWAGSRIAWLAKQLVAKETHARFVIEGEWSGYRSSQRRVVHRTVHKAAFKRLRAWADKTHSIQYTDGTALYIRVRYCKPRERVKEIHGYDSLISDCARHDVSSVAALPKADAP